MRGQAHQLGAAPERYSNEWYTPPAIFEALGLTFDMDVAGPPGGVPWIPAAQTLTVDDDGLVAPWSGRVWMNPPYGRGQRLGEWTRRFADHGNGVALVFARTDTRWWHDHVARADAVCFVRGRLTFVPGPGAAPVVNNAGNASALIASGAECVEAVERSGLGLTLRHGGSR